MMSSWTCERDPAATCTTTPAHVLASHHVESLRGASEWSAGKPDRVGDATFNIPFRPSESAVCGDRRWSPDDTAASCVSGFGNTIQFNLAGRGVSLPDRVIIALAYDTQSYGEHPIGTDGPYNSLNVALFGAPTVGSLPRPDDGYWDSQTPGNYCDGGTGGVGPFRLDAGCWNTGAPDFVPYQPAVRVDATTTTGPQGPAGPAGSTGATGATGPSGGVLGAVAHSKKCKKKSKKKSKRRARRRARPPRPRSARRSTSPAVSEESATPGFPSGPGVAILLELPRAWGRGFFSVRPRRPSTDEVEETWPLMFESA